MGRRQCAAAPRPTGRPRRYSAHLRGNELDRAVSSRNGGLKFRQYIRVNAVADENAEFTAFETVRTISDDA